MKQTLVVVFLILLLSGCEKEQNLNSIAAGDLNNKTTYSLNYIESIPDVVSHDFYGFDWRDTPITIDGTDDPDIRVGYSWGTNKGELFHKAFRIGSNSNGFEFAINESDILITQDDTLTFVRIYNFSDLISENQHWVEGDFGQLFYLSLFYKNDSNEYRINQNLSDKYIGIRKLRDGKMVYGWIKIEITDNDILILKESCFNN